MSLKAHGPYRTKIMGRQDIDPRLCGGTEEVGGVEKRSGTSVWIGGSYGNHPLSPRLRPNDWEESTEKDPPYDQLPLSLAAAET